MKFLITILFTAIYSAAFSSDLEMFQLKGAVDSICITSNDAGLEWQTEFTFDEDGNLIEIDGEEFECERDAMGKIQSLVIEYAAEDDESVISTMELVLKYDSAGRVTSVESITPEEPLKHKYHYGDDGILRQKDEEFPDYTESITYTYLKYDSHGNWTERVEQLSSMNQSITQKREIFYSE